MSCTLWAVGSNSEPVTISIDPKVVHSRLNSFTAFRSKQAAQDFIDGVEPKTEEQDKSADFLGASEIRSLAKEAGIEGHETKRIKTLEAELECLTEK